MFRKVWFWLLLIYILAVGIRFYFLSSGAILFGFDQGRDAFLIQEILHGNLKILGPSTSGVSGFYHGVLYYYFMLPGYLLGHGSPIFAAHYQSLFNALTIFVVYFILRLLTQKALLPILGSLLFAVSYESVQYATWLSNPAMGIWFVPIIYLGLIIWLQKNKSWGLVLTGLAFGLSIQSNISLVYHILPILFLVYPSLKRLNFKNISYFVLALFIGVSSMVVSEIKFGFQSLSGISNILGVSDVGIRPDFGDVLVIYLNKMGKTFAYNLFPQVPAFGGLLGIFLLIWAFKNYDQTKKILLVWILSYLVPAMFGGLNVPHVTVGIGVGIIILFTLFINSLWQKHKFISVILVMLCLAFNLHKNLTSNNQGQIIFAVQKGMLLHDQLKVVEYTYQNSAQKDFSISTLTSPLFINTTWSYLYNWYGLSQYGYLPSWVGKDQIGLLGNNLPQDSPKDHYFIVEDTTGIPLQYQTYAYGEQDAKFDLKDQIKFGELIVQYRSQH